MKNVYDLKNKTKETFFFCFGVFLFQNNFLGFGTKGPKDLIPKYAT